MPEHHCLVTGANGFLGMNLVEQLTKARWRVIALCQPGTDFQYLRRFPVDLVECDIRDAASVVSAVPEKVEAVFHTAAVTSLWSRRRAVQREVNVAGTRNVVRACLDREVDKLIHT
jgi:nucleoside-diphosphate-sugar epimerase